MSEYFRPVVVASIIIVLALVAGLLGNRLLRRRDNDDCPSVTDLVSPLETLAVLVLAFVLVGAAESYSGAEDAAAREASTIDHMFETADYAPAEYREPLQAVTVCYAKAVRHHSWPAMAGGGESSAPSVWTTQLRTYLKQMAATDQGSVFEILVNTDRDRSEARQSRVSESTPAIPEIVYWFMALTLALTVAGYAYSIRLRESQVHIFAVAVLTALFVASMLLIRDVDTPFAGPISIGPTEMTFTEADISEDFAEEYGSDRLPCDEHGNRI
ncbi:bestrophin-like domain [Actinophytocola sediminis]